LDIKKFNISSDKKFAFDLLHQKHILIVPGSGFDWTTPDHFRIVMLPDAERMAQAIRDIGDFLKDYRQ
ncbi:MAG: aminotransferase, partial [Clostridia bacterium]|nr:aminotransferase [Clostridia bacterium]